MNKMNLIIPHERSLIISCDVEYGNLSRLVKETSDIHKVGGYKLPYVSIEEGLKHWVKRARKYTDKSLILDGQKFSPDPKPETNEKSIMALKRTGIDAVIVFPFTGPEAQEYFTKIAREEDLKIIIGGMMTHRRYLSGEKGYLPYSAVQKMYRNAAKQGVKDFFLPGNKPDSIRTIRQIILNEGVQNPEFYLAGFVAQKGEIETAKEILKDDRFHIIVGEAIYNAENPRQAALDLSSKLY